MTSENRHRLESASKIIKEADEKIDKLLRGTTGIIPVEINDRLYDAIKILNEVTTVGMVA